MSFPSNKELLLNDFINYLRKELKLSPSKVDEYGLAARQFIEYVQQRPGGREWQKLIREEQAGLDFIDSRTQTDSDETSNKKRVAVQTFQEYLKSHGLLAWYATGVRQVQEHPVIFLLGLLLAGILALNEFLPYFGLPPESIRGLLIPSLTPTVTNTQPPTKTPTKTLTPSPTLTFTPTLTLTPTLTPTPNETQVFLATQLPTANAAFTPQARTRDDGSKQVFVPAGSFVAGDHTNAGFSDEDIHQVYTDSFWIDRFLVTNSEFAKCPENICGKPESSISHKRPNGYYGVPEFVNFPVMEITWYQAEAFCEWRGGRLPTEAEWEKAAGWDPVSGEMLIYPWGNEHPNDDLANYDNVDLDTTEVGAYPEGVSPVGAYDMVGNVWEWVFDWYGPYDLSQQINPMGSPSGDEKVVRGGSWSNDTEILYLRVANRGHDRPNGTTNETGFRCVFVE